MCTILVNFKWKHQQMQKRFENAKIFEFQFELYKFRNSEIKKLKALKKTFTKYSETSAFWMQIYGWNR